MINVIYAYAYIANYYNGDYLNCPMESTIVFLDLSDNMKLNTVFKNPESAIASIVHNIINVSIITFNILNITSNENIKIFAYCFQRNWLPQDEQTLLVFKEAGNKIMQGPDEKNEYLYIAVALSEIHRLLTMTIEEISKNKIGDKEFVKKFVQRYNVDSIDLSRKQLLLHCKKLEYYISWTKNRHIKTYT